MSDIEKLIEETKKKLAQLKERQRIERAAERKRLSAENRKADSRHKMLVGIGILQAIKNKRMSEQQLIALISDGITNQSDREFLKQFYDIPMPTATALAAPAHADAQQQ
ncbi:hypothetical protein V0R37_15060 [Pollutimonas sp. H1-120]|uniref:hypothetical protein n=1 Tax=Pollutimonas sp. H1-120 TaxID=3148824 RepID=UPI003B52CEF3